MSLAFSPEEIAFSQAVRAAILGEAAYPEGHKYAGKTNAQVREEIAAGTFVPAPEFIPSEIEQPKTTAPL